MGTSMKRGSLVLVALGAVAFLSWALLWGVEPGAGGEGGGGSAAGEGTSSGIDVREPVLEGLGRSERVQARLAAARVVGTVHAEEGPPVGDAEVEIWQRPSRPRPTSSLQRLAQRFEPPPEGRLLQRVRTDAAGRFAFEGVPDGVKAEVRVGASAGRTGAWAPLTVQGGTTHRVALVVRPGRGLRVRVVDREGEGLVAWVHAAGWTTSGRVFVVNLRRTDEQGRVELAVPDGEGRLTVQVPGRGAWEGTPVRTPREDELLVRFVPAEAARIAGRLTGTDGRPVPGAEVVASVRTDAAQSPREGAMRLRTATDADGRYELAGLLPGVLDGVAVAATGYVSLEGVHRGLEVLPGSPLRLDLVLVRGAVLEGTVRLEDGAPLAAASIHARAGTRRSPAHARTAETDGAGRFTLDDLPPLLEVSLTVLSHGALRPLATGEKRITTSLPGEGERARLDLVVAAGSTLRGRVLDGQGLVVEGALVTARAGDHSWVFDVLPLVAATSADGAFALPDLSKESPWTVEAEAAGRRSRPVVVRWEEGDPAPLDLVVSAPATLTGRVVGVDGEGVQRRVTCNGRETGRRVASVATSPDGTFTVDDLPPGAYAVTLVPPGAIHGAEGSPPMPTVEVDLAEGEHRDGVLLVAPHDLSIAGRVVDLEGRPVPRARVTVGGPALLRPRDVRTDPDGSFLVASLPPGVYVVLAEGAEPLEGVEAGTHGLRLVAPVLPMQRLEGRVLDPEGRPVPLATVQVRGERNHWASTQARHGLFAITFHTMADVVPLQVHDARDLLGRSLPLRPQELTIRLDGRPVEIHLERGLVLAGRFVGPDGGGVEGVAVEARGRSSSMSFLEPFRVRTDAEGRFRFESLGEGTVQVAATPPEGWVRPLSWNVEAGRDDLRIVLERAVRVAGRVVDPDGVAVAGASVSANWISREPPGGGIAALVSDEQITDAQGRFVLAGVGAAELSLRVGPRPADAGAWAYVPVTLANVDPTAGELLIRLALGAEIEGVVVDDAGQPIEDASIGTWAGHVRQTTGADGRFRLRGLAPGACELHVFCEGYAGIGRIPATAPSSGVRIVLTRVPRIQGRLVGEGVAGFTVYFTALVDGQRRLAGSSVDETGLFSFDAPVDEPGVLYAHRDDDDRYALLGDVRPAGEHRLVLVPGERIAGRIDGGAGAHGYVQAHSDRGMTLRGVIAEDGTFVVHGVPPGTYGIEAAWWRESGVHGSARLEGVRAGAKDLVLRHQPR